MEKIEVTKEWWDRICQHQMLLLKIHSIYLLISPTADSCITWYTRDKNKIELWKCLLSSTCCPSTEHCRESLNPGVDWDLFFRDCMSSRCCQNTFNLSPNAWANCASVAAACFPPFFPAGITPRRTWAWSAAAVKLLLTRARGQKSWIHRLF